MIDQDWDSSPAVGHEFGSMVIDLQTRELLRRNALWRLRNTEERSQATESLLRVWRADRDYPIGPAAGLTVDEIRTQVQIHDEEGAGSLVCISEVPEPWATRFQIASQDSTTRGPGGYYAANWETFLDRWTEETGRTDDLVEQEIERQVTVGIRAAQARSRATLSDLGIDPDGLQVWVAEMVGKGRWPAGDLLEAFRAWSAKSTPNAD